MTGRPTHLLLDFFGTLVDYSPSRTEQGYPRSHRLLLDYGADLAYERFLDRWGAVSARFDAASAVDDREFSMTDVSSTYLAETLPDVPTDAQVETFVATYLAEWTAAVHAPVGLAALLTGLRAQRRLAVVSNTHSPTMVPALLSRLGVADLMDAVVLSVDVGRRKPHRAIYGEALQRLGIDPGDAWFVGDSYDADYTGPRACGIEARLIDPHGRSPVPDAHRLSSIFDLPAALAAV